MSNPAVVVITGVSSGIGREAPERFANDDAFVLIEGRIVITMDTGERFEMIAGDAVSIPAGHTGVCKALEFSR